MPKKPYNALLPFIKDYNKAYKNLVVSNRLWLLSNKLGLVEEQKLLEDYFIEQSKTMSNALYHLAPDYDSIKEFLDVHS